jgi:hypothetical protein
MGKKTARLAGLAALAGVAYANRDKLSSLFDGKDKGDTRPARPESTETRGMSDEDKAQLARESNRGPIGSTPVQGGTTRSAPAPRAVPAESSDRNENYGNEGRRSTMGSSASPTYMSKTPGGDAKRTEGNQPMPSLKAVENRIASNRTDAMRNASRANIAGANRQKAMRANPEAQAVERVYPEENLIGGPGIKVVGAAAKNLANRGGKAVSEYVTPRLGGPAAQTSTAAPRLGGPTPQLTGPSKADLLARDRAARASTRQEDMLRENARRSGLDPDNINPAVANKVRENMGGADFSLGRKKGGAVKAKRMAYGGMASGGMTASRRGDGIASRGKTRGKIC